MPKQIAFRVQFLHQFLSTYHFATYERCSMNSMHNGPPTMRCIKPNMVRECN